MFHNDGFLNETQEVRDRRFLPSQLSGEGREPWACSGVGLRAITEWADGENV